MFVHRIALRTAPEEDEAKKLASEKLAKILDNLPSKPEGILKNPEKLKKALGGLIAWGMENQNMGAADIHDAFQKWAGKDREKLAKFGYISSLLAASVVVPQATPEADPWGEISPYDKVALAQKFAYATYSELKSIKLSKSEAEAAHPWMQKSKGFLNAALKAGTSWHENQAYKQSFLTIVSLNLGALYGLFPPASYGTGEDAPRMEEKEKLTRSRSIGSISQLNIRKVMGISTAVTPLNLTEQMQDLASQMQYNVLVNANPTAFQNDFFQPQSGPNDLPQDQKAIAWLNAFLSGLYAQTATGTSQLSQQQKDTLKTYLQANRFEGQFSAAWDPAGTLYVSLNAKHAGDTSKINKDLFVEFQRLIDAGDIIGAKVLLNPDAGAAKFSELVGNAQDNSIYRTLTDAIITQSVYKAYNELAGLYHINPEFFQALIRYGNGLYDSEGIEACLLVKVGLSVDIETTGYTKNVSRITEEKTGLTSQPTFTTTRLSSKGGTNVYGVGVTHEASFLFPVRMLPYYLRFSQKAGINAGFDYFGDASEEMKNAAKSKVGRPYYQGTIAGEGMIPGPDIAYQVGGTGWFEPRSRPSYHLTGFVRKPFKGVLGGMAFADVGVQVPVRQQGASVPPIFSAFVGLRYDESLFRAGVSFSDVVNASRGQFRTLKPSVEATFPLFGLMVQASAGYTFKSERYLPTFNGTFKVSFPFNLDAIVHQQ